MVLQNLNHHVTGWVDWNFALDMKGGPNWSGNFVDAPIIVNKVRTYIKTSQLDLFLMSFIIYLQDTNEFYKQPMFYALGHFSKFIQENAVRKGIKIERKFEHLAACVLQNPDESYVAIVLNK